MQAIILAAGMGTRIPQYTQAMPKCMIQINGKPLLAHSIDALCTAGVSRIIIGLGYKGQVIRDFVAAHYPQETGLRFDFVENPDYGTTNNIYSLYLTKDFFVQDDSLLLESDLIYEKEILQDLIGCPAHNAAVLSPFEGWMDGSCCLLDSEGHISGMVGKKEFRYEDAGTYYKTVNIWKFSKEFIRSVYLPFLSAYMSAYGKNEYYETVLKLVAGNNPAALGSLIVPGDRWYEVDDIADLSVAEKRFAPRESRYTQILEEGGGGWRFPGMADFTVDSNPFFPIARILPELRYGLADCISLPPSNAQEQDILAAKILGADSGQVCVCPDGGLWAGTAGTPAAAEGGAAADASYADFAELLEGAKSPHGVFFLDLGKRFGLPGLDAQILFCADGRRLLPCRGKRRLASTAEHFMQIAGKYKKDCATALSRYGEECRRMERELAETEGVGVKKLGWNKLALNLSFCPTALDARKLAAFLLDRHKLLVAADAAPHDSEEAGTAAGTISIYVRDRAANDRLLAALRSAALHGEN